VTKKPPIVIAIVIVIVIVINKKSEFVQTFRSNASLSRALKVNIFKHLNIIQFKTVFLIVIITFSSIFLNFFFLTNLFAALL
jgi:hypothetical protein